MRTDLNNLGDLSDAATYADKPALIAVVMLSLGLRTPMQEIQSVAIAVQLRNCRLEREFAPFAAVDLRFSAPHVAATLAAAEGHRIGRKPR